MAKGQGQSPATSIPSDARPREVIDSLRVDASGQAFVVVDLGEGRSVTLICRGCDAVMCIEADGAECGECGAVISLSSAKLLFARSAEALQKVAT